MTIISLTDCCHQLAIDPKTLRHWMRLSHLEAQTHPLDARCKFLTREQLQLLADTHHRTLETNVKSHLRPEISVLPTPAQRVSETVFSDVRPNLGGDPLSMILHILGLLLKRLLGLSIMRKCVTSPDFSAPMSDLTKQLTSLQAHIVALQDQLTLLHCQLQKEQQWRISEASTMEVSFQPALDSFLEKAQETPLNLSLEKPAELSLESVTDLSLEKSQEAALNLSLEKPAELSLESVADLSLEKSQESSRGLSSEKSAELSLESVTDFSPEKSVLPSRIKRQARGTANGSSIDEHRRSRVLPWVEYGTGDKYVVICPEQGLLDFSPDSPEWFAWLSTLSSFRFTGKQWRFTAHRGGSTSPNRSWSATRSIRNRSYSHPLGKTEGLTVAHLDSVAAVLQSHLN